MSNRRYLRFLFEQQEGCCFWCLRKVLMESPDGCKKAHWRRQATLDHIFHKKERTGLPEFWSELRVMACHKCNLIRNDVFQKRFATKNSMFLWQD